METTFVSVVQSNEHFQVLELKTKVLIMLFVLFTYGYFIVLYTIYCSAAHLHRHIFRMCYFHRILNYINGHPQHKSQIKEKWVKVVEKCLFFV